MGRHLQFGYDASGRIVKLIDPAGGVLHYGYDANHNLATVTYQDGELVTYHYGESQYTGGANLPNALTGITDENGVRYVTYSYDNSGLVIGEVFPAVGTNTNRYQLTRSYNQATVTDPLGAQRTYEFSPRLGVAKNTRTLSPPGAHTSLLSYDANGNITGQSKGYFTATYSYDLTRNLETQRVEGTGAIAQTISTQWHSHWRLPIQIAEPKKRSTFVYSGDLDPATGNILSCAPSSAVVPSLTGGTQPIGVLCKKTEHATTDANGSAGFSSGLTGSPRIWRWTYNQYGQVLSEDGPRTDVADVTTYTYYDATDPDLDKRGRLATITNALGHVTQITAYDAHGNPLTIIDPNSVVSTLTYDLRQRLLSRTIGSETTTYTWDAVDQLTQFTLPDGSTLTYTYDAAHRLNGITDGLGNTLHYTLDAIGNRIQEDIRDPQGALARTRQREYNALNRLVKELGAQNQATLYAYDGFGNRTTHIDPLNKSTTRAYDIHNRLTQATDPGNGLTRYAWDGQNQLTSVTDPRNLVTTYILDGLGNLSQQTSPDTGLTQFTFDAAGNEITRTDAKTQTITTTYDALNRPTQISYPGGQVQYTWDQGTNGKGRLTQIDEYSGTTLTASQQYAWDGQGRIVQETRALDNLTHTQSYAYSNGRLTGITLASGRQIAYTHNNVGQITRIELTDNTAGGSGQTKVIARNISYHPFGGVKRWIDAASQEHTRSQDLDGRISAYSLGATPWLLGDDAAGRITGLIDGNNATNSGAYGYDSLDRLTGAQLPPNTTHGYGYDATGNRTSQSTDGTTRTYTIDSASNRLQSLSNPTQSFSHDANGSLTSDGTNQYAYDGRGRLVSATTAAGTVSYRLDAHGQRVRKTVTHNGATTRDTLYHYDLSGHLIGESDGTGTITRDILWLDDLPLAIVETGTNPVTERIYPIHADHLNTPRLVTDETNAIIWRHGPLTEPFGNASPEEDPNDTGQNFTLNLRFPGQYYDEETNTHYNTFRDYDPKIGRYFQADPIGLQGGSNPYAYAQGNPIAFTDPLGLQAAIPAPVPGISIPPICTAGPVGAIVCGATAGYGIGTLVYPHVEPRLSHAVDYVCRTNDKEERCKKEWEDAFEQCDEWLVQPNPPRSLTGGYRGRYSCARGLVSEVCGGNPVDRGRAQ